MAIKHISFNPSFSLSTVPTTLSGICSDQEKDGWRLVSIIPHTQYESVAVFERSNVVGS